MCRTGTTEEVQKFSNQISISLWNGLETPVSVTLITILEYFSFLFILGNQCHIRHNGAELLFLVNYSSTYIQSLFSEGLLLLQTCCFFLISHLHFCS